jgi:hypothetical protein
MRWVAVLGVLLALGATGCGSASAPAQRYISSDELGDAWPLTVSNGTLGCQGAGAVSFTTDEGIVYAVNAPGAAWSRTNNLGWNDIDTIQGDDVVAGGKMKLGPLTAAGVRLCETAEQPGATTTNG